MGDRDTFVLRKSFLRHVDGLTDAEAGQLIRAVRCYVDGLELPVMDRAVQMVFGFIKMQIDTENEKYEQKCKTARASINRRWEKNTDVYERIQTNTNVSSEIRPYTNVKNVILTREKDKDMDKDKDPYPYPHTPLVTEGDVFGFVEDDVVIEGICTEEGAREGETGAASGADPPKKNEAAVKHKHGQYGWVRLTGEEYNRLLTEFGNEVLRRYIAIVDEYAQTHGNAKKYKDWNLVVRKAIRERWGNKQNESKTSTVTGRKMYDRELRRIEELEREEALKRGNG